MTWCEGRRKIRGGGSDVSACFGPVQSVLQAKKSPRKTDCQIVTYLASVFCLAFLRVFSLLSRVHILDTGYLQLLYKEQRSIEILLIIWIKCCSTPSLLSAEREDIVQWRHSPTVSCRRSSLVSLTPALATDRTQPSQLSFLTEHSPRPARWESGSSSPPIVATRR